MKKEKKGMVIYFSTKEKNVTTYFAIINGVTFKVFEDIKLEIEF